MPTRELPRVDFDGRTWFLDVRLREMRDVNDPHARIPIPSEVPCPACNGTGQQEIKVSASGSGKPPEVTKIGCITCDGKKIVPIVTVFRLQAEREAWCKCGQPDKAGTRYWPDGTNPACSKHCYTCNNCGKLVQVG